MRTPKSSFCTIEEYSLGTLANGGVVLSFRVPGSGEVCAIAFDDQGLNNFLQRLTSTREIARRRRASTANEQMRTMN
jgi:hypothetical protein